MDPDDVYSKKTFATVMYFHVKWKEEAEYNVRFERMRKQLEG